MSKYTTQVRFICESASGAVDSVGYNDVNKTIASAIPKIFDFDFPIYDESYRSVLCTKILKHYYTREIGAETVGLWKLWLDTRLNEIMSYYNQLYASTLIEFNPMYDVDLTTTHTRDNEGVTNVTDSGDTTNEGSSEQNDNSSGNNTNKDLYSDTPQGALTNVENQEYLTNARMVSNNGSSTSKSNNTYNGSVKTESESETAVTSTEEYLQKIIGKTGGSSYSKRLLEFRNTFINIDTMIINELSDLFLNLW